MADDALSDAVEDVMRLERGIAELYQIIGILAEEAGHFDHPKIQRALDWAANPQSEGELDVLPFFMDPTEGSKEEHPGASTEGSQSP